MFRAIAIMLCAVFLQAQETRLQILETTDVRGHVLPQDVFTLQPAPGGWARVGTLIRTLRSNNPATLLIDNGDGTEGQPINYVWSHLKPDAAEPTMALMNALGFQAMVVGHLEMAHGIRLMRAMEEQAQFPWLAANITFAGTKKHAFTPYLTLERSGVRVAVLGLVCQAQGRLAGREASGEFAFQDPVACAREMIPALRGKERADVVVVALHGGQGSGDENPADALAEQVPGIDLILAGHTRQQVSTRIHGVPILQAGENGQALGVADLVLRKARSRWEVVSVATRLEKVGDLEPDAAVLQATAPMRTLADTYLDTFATDLRTDLDSRWCRMEDTPLAHLLHTVTGQATGAQITAVPVPPSRLFIPKGPTSVRQFYALSPGEEGLARIRVTGRQLRAYLEQSARTFAFSHQPDLFNRAVAPEDFDTLDGCTYAFDLGKPAGSRVVDLAYKGRPVKDDQTFTLGLYGRRLAGAGGFLAAMDWHGEPEWVSTQSMRNLLLAYVLSRPALAPGTSGNWRTIPYLDRERVLAQEP